MIRTLNEFVGEYTVRHAAGQGIITAGDRLFIGTGLHEDPKSDGMKVGVTILDAAGIQKLPLPTRPPALFFFVDGTLNHSGYLEDPTQPLNLQISLYTYITDGGGLYRAAYGITSYGDPENVGVWGADDGGG